MRLRLFSHEPAGLYGRSSLDGASLSSTAFGEGWSDNQFGHCMPIAWRDQAVQCLLRFAWKGFVYFQKAREPPKPHTEPNAASDLWGITGTLRRLGPLPLRRALSTWHMVTQLRNIEQLEARYAHSPCFDNSYGTRSGCPARSYCVACCNSSRLHKQTERYDYRGYPHHGSKSASHTSYDYAFLDRLASS